jgi:hypothetical protein
MPVASITAHSLVDTLLIFIETDRNCLVTL